MAIEYSVDNGVGVIRLRRFPSNSYDLAGIRQLAEAIRAAANDSAARAVIVASALKGVFSGGADILSKSALDNREQIMQIAHEAFSEIAKIPKPFLAQIEGLALGGGLEIALACDLRFAATGDYPLGLPETELGLMPGGGGTQRLSRLIGPAKALDLMFAARRLTPMEAHQVGIVDRLFPPEEAAQQTRAYAEHLARGPALAIGSIKQAVWQGIDQPLAEGLRLERDYLVPVLRSADFQEGLSAFMEKRPPKFQDE